MTIRRGELSDLEAIRAIQQASPEAAQWEPREYLQYDLQVAVRDDAVAGFLVTRTLAEGESEILNLAVAPQWRRQGVARALLAACLRHRDGDTYLEVRSSNQAAQKFYRSAGFQPVAERPQYYSAPGDSAIVMKFHSC